MDDYSYLEGIVPHSYIQKGKEPPIAFPLSEGEIENFPRHLTAVDRMAYTRERFVHRREYYRGLLVQIASNARRPGHGICVVILIPATFEEIVAQIERGPGYKNAEVAEVLKKIYYLGLILEEIETDVCSKTLTSYLQRAERVLDIL